MSLDNQLSPVWSLKRIVQKMDDRGGFLPEEEILKTALPNFCQYMYRPHIVHREIAKDSKDK